MSVWITDRLPTVEDADPRGQIWCMDTTRDVVWMHYGVYLNLNKGSADIVPWQPIIYPEPYVKPKVWTWELADVRGYVDVSQNGKFRWSLRLDNGVTENHINAMTDAWNRLEDGI